ncbi:MAG: phosphatidylserine decarboxylase [Acidobacteriota bacterium]|nr:phosphatidylserine decarboxylase [Acidobacteriota bacterium]MDH3522991.1 phosphatidylserine decarboxylase [Acidobacteriota bacterium]
MRFAREAAPFVAPLAVVALALAAAGWRRSALVAGLATVAVLLFFRIPRRSPDADPSAVLAPANGVVTRIETVREPRLGGEPYRRVVTFLSVFDVHVQRSPVAAKVVECAYTAGRKVAAFRKDAGEVNESHWTVLEDEHGRRIAVQQIAGLLARRVVSYCRAGRSFERGELIGLIKFGSRVDLYVPADYRLAVEPGARLVEGRTVVARPPDDRGPMIEAR